MSMKFTINMLTRTSIFGEKRKRDASVIAPSARILTSAIAALLLLPVAMIGIQNNAELESFHNRSLRHWPEAKLFIKKPVDYFNATKGWLGDRIFPIIEVSVASKKALLYVLNSSPQKRVTIGRNGYLFLNGASESDVYGIFENGCLRAHEPAISVALKAALQSVSRYSRNRGITVDVVVIPTMASIYANNLPNSVPIKIRAACSERSRGNSPLVVLAEESGGKFVYPLLEMNAARDDEAFFPKANFHPNGLSLKVVRDTYLLKQRLSQPSGEILELGSGPSEILSSYLIVRNFPVYNLRNEALVVSPSNAEVLAKLARDLFTVPRSENHAYESPNAPNRETVLMLSDSFGGFSSAFFAGAFSKLLQVNTNGMAESNAPVLVDRIDKTQKIHRIILLVNEGNIARVISWAKAFGGVSD